MDPALAVDANHSPESGPGPLRAALSLAIRWEGVLLGLVPAGAMILILHVSFGSRPWGEPLTPEDPPAVPPESLSVAIHAILSGAVAVLLVPLVLGGRGLNPGLLLKRPLALLAASALPYLSREMFAAWGVEASGLSAVVFDSPFATVLPAWLAASIVARDLRAEPPGLGVRVLASALLVTAAHAGATWALSETVLTGGGFLVAILGWRALTWWMYGLLLAGGWIGLVGQAWFLGRVLQPGRAPAPA